MIPTSHHRKTLALLFCATLSITATAVAAADDIAAGRAKAQSCAVCHGALGVSVTPDAPNLAGQPALYVAAQLRAYRNNTRKHEVMSVMAQSLSDADIALLADWFASIKIEAQAGSGQSRP